MLLILGSLPVLYQTWPQIASLFGDGTVAIVAGIVLASIAAGHFMGGQHPGNRTALGFTCAMRHPGIAMTMGATNFPENRLVPAAILLYILVALILTTIYGKLRLRHTSASAGGSR